MKFSVRNAIQSIRNKKEDEMLIPETVEEVYYSPGIGMGKVAEFIGIILRGITIFCALFGLTHMFYQAIGVLKEETDYRFFSLTGEFIFIVCLIFTIAATVAPINKVTKAAVPLTLFGFMALTAVRYGNAFVLVENAMRRLYNDFIEGVVNDGYTGMADYVASERYSFDEETLVKWGVVLVVTVLSILFYFSVSRKTNIIIYALALAAVIAPVFFFNIVKGNFGFAFVVASIAGFISMRIVDSRYGGRLERRQKKRRESAEALAAKKEARGKKKLAKLRLMNAADKVYETAIDADMGARRARLAKRSVIQRARAEEKEVSRLEKERAAEEKAAVREKKKEERARAAAEKAARRAEIKREKTLPANEASAAKSERVKREKKERYEAKRARSARREEKRRAARYEMFRRRRNRAAGGFAALAASLVALIACVFPFIVSKNVFPKIKFIDDGMNYLRTSMTGYLVGDGVDLTTSPYGKYETFNYETLSFDARNYDGVQIFRVEAPSDNTIYLKSRTARDYSLENDTWSFSSNQDIINMKREFGRQFTPDVITKNAYGYLYPLSSEMPTRFGTINFSAYGFNVEQVHVIRANGSSTILFIPSVMNPELGVREYDSLDEADDSYSAFYDGIYTSRNYGVGEGGYSSISYVYNMRRANLSSTLDSERNVLSLVYDLAKRERAGEDESALYEEYLREAKALGVTVSSDLADRYFNSMSNGERDDFVEQMKLEEKYRAYAEETYTPVCGSEQVASLAKEIFAMAEAEKGSPLSRYESVMAVIRYLDSGDYTYSLTPPSPENAEGSVLEAFLFDTKCGYCSHFASAATLLIREAGIPVRLTEGYHVSDFYTSGGAGAVDRYASDVRDRNSHTWIEVYFDTIGWIPFEATVTYTEYDYNEPDTSDVILPIDDPDITEPDTPDTEPANDPTPSTPDNNQTSARVAVDLSVLWNRFKGYFFAVLGIAAGIVLVRIIILLIKKSGDMIVKRRRDMLFDIKKEDHYLDPKADRQAEAKYIIDSIFKIFKALDIGPDKGEQLSEFAERLSRDYRGLSGEDHAEVMNCILKEEYGHGLNRTEMSCIASYLEDIVESIYAGLTRRERIKYRYIKHIL